MNGKLQNDHTAPFDSAACFLNKRLHSILKETPTYIKENVQEIRLRAGMPIVLCSPGKSYFYTSSAAVVSVYGDGLQTASLSDIRESFNSICGYSVYSYQNELKNGFITVKGGHRIGISGTAVYKDGKVNTLKDVSSLNVRIARQIKGVSRSLIGQVDFLSGGVLIAGPPGSGKTTMLRDIARKLSLTLRKIVVIDERGELAALYSGSMQNDLGLCDVLNEYKKADALEVAIRSLSPQTVVCDELGSIEEVRAVNMSLNAGVNIIATIHAGSYEELLNRGIANELLSTGAFKTVVTLNTRDKPATIKSINILGDKDD